jgi:hypothetical protein
MSRRMALAVPVLFASMVLGAWPIQASGQTTETNEHLPCSAVPRFCELITQEAGRTGLDPALVDAVIKVESDYRQETIGAAGEVGLMQVRPSTARLLGFHGNDKELADPATNIRLGVAYLATAWSLAHGDLCRSLMKYRAGHGEERMTPLSLEYCRRAREHLAAQNQQLTEGMSIRLPPKVQAVNSKVPAVDRRLKGPAFWAAHEARVKAIKALVHQRWALIAKRSPI